MSEPSASGFRIRVPLLIGLGWWLLALLLSVLQAGREEVRLATPYGLQYLRTQIIPVIALLIFYVLALLLPSRFGKPARLFDQLFFLLLTLGLTYWAATAPLRLNWILLLGVWWLLPSLFLGQPGLIAPTTLVSLGSLLVTIVLFELLLRPFPRLWPGYARMVGSNWRRLHADIPTYEYQSKGVQYRINALGFRGEDPVPERVDVVALGDSFTFGVGTQYPWPELLARDTGMTVLNLGMGGTDPPKFVNPLIEFGLPREPQYVVLAYFEGNDLYTCYQPASPAGPRWGDALVLPDLIGGVREMVRFLSREQQITSELTYDIATPFERVINGRQVTLTFSPAYAATLLLDRSAITNSENYRIASASLERIAQLITSSGAQLVIAYIPERTHVYWPLIRDDDELLAGLNSDMYYRWEQRLGCLTLVRGREAPPLDAFRTEMDRTIDDQRALIHEFATQHEIPFLDLTPILQAQAAAGITLADPLETHYNDQVNAILAEEIAGFLAGLRSR
ncbi:MAG: GDSL-type esterase/lipase family protein [Anaerolineales bacterium]